MIRVVVLLLALLPCGAALAAEQEPIEGERVFIVHDYRYDPAGSGGDPEAGHALCGTRCNAISVDYRNYIDPGGWRFIKVATAREVRLPLGNPFLGGECVCTADEYVVMVNEFNQRKQQAGR